MDREMRQQMVAVIPRLRRFTVTLTGNNHDGDDLAQSTIERAITRFDSWQPGTRLDSWMFRIAQNLWIDQIRSHNARGEHVEMTEIQHLSDHDGRRITESQLLLRQTEAAIHQLPDEQRSVVALVLIEGLSYKEAAEVLEVPPGTIMSRLARARTRLAEQLLSGDEV